MRYQVIKPFSNMGVVVMPGDFVECDSARAAKLRRLGLIGGAVKEIEKGPSTFDVTYTDDSGNLVTKAVEAASYQQAVDKVIQELFVESEEVVNPAPKKPAPKRKVK